MVDIENALNNANAQINSSLNNIDTELERINSAITSIHASINTSNTKIAENKDAIMRLVAWEERRQKYTIQIVTEFRRLQLTV